MNSGGIGFGPTQTWCRIRGITRRAILAVRVTPPTTLKRVAPTGERQFLTVSNAAYLANVVALHDSLRRVCRDPFGLRVVCMDTESERLLEALALPEVTVIPARDVEQFDPALVEVRDGR